MGESEALGGIQISPALLRYPSVPLPVFFNPFIPADWRRGGEHSCFPVGLSCVRGWGKVGAPVPPLLLLVLLLPWLGIGLPSPCHVLYIREDQQANLKVRWYKHMQSFFLKKLSPSFLFHHPLILHLLHTCKSHVTCATNRRDTRFHWEDREKDLFWMDGGCLDSGRIFVKSRKINLLGQGLHTLLPFNCICYFSEEKSAVFIVAMCRDNWSAVQYDCKHVKCEYMCISLHFFLQCSCLPMHSRMAGRYKCVDHTKLTACPVPSGIWPALFTFTLTGSPPGLFSFHTLMSAIYACLCCVFSFPVLPSSSCPLGLGIITRVCLTCVELSRPLKPLALLSCAV